MSSLHDFTVYIVKTRESDIHAKFVMFVCHFHHDNGDPCSHVIDRPRDFFHHMREHAGDKPFKCDFIGCNESFSLKGSLKNHKELHEGIKRITCPECGKRF